ncbi:MAG: HEPN domain-containing protein [Bacteroidia bacterium]|nr:HEPN domain-containing protein [Bacteroidia bacterium]
MDESKINVNTIIKSWEISSQENFDTMIDMYNSKRYNWALFLGHLCLEKLLKAYYVKVHQNHSPYSHSLLHLAKLTNMELTDEQKTDFATITTFNINARYDDYKQSFFVKCTKEFSDKWVEIIKKHRLWMLELIKS